MNPRKHQRLPLLATLLVSGIAAAQSAPVAEPVQAPVEAPAWTPEERSAIELLRSLRKRERPDDMVLASRLAQPGVRVLPLLFDVLAAREVPALDGGEPQILSEIQEKIILLALPEFERGPVLRHISMALEGRKDPRLRGAAMSCIGAVGQSNDILQLFDLVLTPEEKTPDARLQKVFTTSVTALLRHDPRTYDQLVNLRRITKVELLPALIEAVGAAHETRGLVYLSEIAYWNDALILEVMNQIPLIGPTDDEGVQKALEVRIRKFLDESRPGHCRAAITALAALDDEEAIAEMIPLLDSEVSGLKDNAYWALKQLTGLAMAPSMEVWSRWHQGELFWLVRKKAREFKRLGESNPAEVADALREILEHPLARSELAAALPDLLKSRWPAIRVLACRTLADLPAHGAVSRLVWALEDPEREVSQAAYTALRRITKLELPDEVSVWQAATNTEPRAAEL